jgi:hypothetical protein
MQGFHQDMFTCAQIVNMTTPPTIPPIYTHFYNMYVSLLQDAIMMPQQNNVPTIHPQVKLIKRPPNAFMLFLSKCRKNSDMMTVAKTQNTLCRLVNTMKCCIEYPNCRRAQRGVPCRTLIVHRISKNLIVWQLNWWSNTRIASLSHIDVARNDWDAIVNCIKTRALFMLWQRTTFHQLVYLSCYVFLIFSCCCRCKCFTIRQISYSFLK